LDGWQSRTDGLQRRSVVEAFEFGKESPGDFGEERRRRSQAKIVTEISENRLTKENQAHPNSKHG
jgi:hypothetical protein